MDAGDQCTAGLNFVTLRPRREVLQDFRDVLSEIYRAEAFFQRARLLARTLDLPHLPAKFTWGGLRRELRSETPLPSHQQSFQCVQVTLQLRVRVKVVVDRVRLGAAQRPSSWAMRARWFRAGPNTASSPSARRT